MIHCSSIDSLRKSLSSFRNKRIGLVPTMGSLHAGHLSLIDQIKAHCDIVVVSIFVNPSQFAEHEDFDSYPRQLEQDLDKLNNKYVDLVFTPTLDDIYPNGHATSCSVTVPQISTLYCGKTRPQFFDGVCSIVLRLFQLTKANTAIFGEKDFQQLTIIKRMVSDLYLDIDILSGPIIREESGLAMSSRNAYLNDAQLNIASRIYKALDDTRNNFLLGNTSSESLIDHCKSMLGLELRLDYCEIINPDTFQSQTEAQKNDRLIIAAYLEHCRLIDNIAL